MNKFSDFATKSNFEVLIVIAVLVIILLLLLAIWLRFRHSRMINTEPMEGEEFENYCAYLLRCNGFEEVHQTPASHDFGCDIIAHKDGVSYGIQCKSYSTPVGIAAIQQAYAGKDFYDCMVGVAMTNSTFTAPAVEMAEKLKIILWDGQKIADMEE